MEQGAEEQGDNASDSSSSDESSVAMSQAEGESSADEADEPSDETLVAKLPCFDRACLVSKVAPCRMLGRQASNSL